MRTRSSSNLPGESSPNPTSSNLRRRNRRHFKQPFILEESPVVTIADQRTMVKLLRAPTEGYAEAIVVPPILSEQFELKHSLIIMMISDQFFRREKDNPHDHIRWFNKITSTIKYKDVPNSTIKLMLFPFSLAGAARRWLEKKPPRSILTWEILFPNSLMILSPSRTTNLRNEISNFQQRFDESFHEACDQYKDLLCACPHHGFTEFHQLDTFYNALNHADQDSLNSATGGNLLERRTQYVLKIIENKSKVCNSQNKSIVSQVKSSDANSSSSFEIAKLTHAVNQQTSVVTTAMTAILKQFQATLPPASVKAVEEIRVTCGGAHPYYQCLAADGNTFLELRDNIQGYVLAAAASIKAVEEICVTCGGAHSYYQCLAADGNTFSELQDNIQGYVSAAAVNYNQGNYGYRPPSVANQIRPPGFAQPNVQNNQNRELEKIKKMNEINMKAKQTQINNVKNELRNEMKTSIQASINTIANPKGKLKAITTRSGLVLDGPYVPVPPPFINLEEDEHVEETLTGQDLAEYTIKVLYPLVQKPKPPSQRNFVVHQRDLLHPNIPYPSRMHKEKQQEKGNVEIHKFWQMFKQLHINIPLADALILIPKYQKMIKALLSNKEKLLELANTPLNENYSAVILKKLHEKLGDPGKFLIPCSFSELKCKAIADLGASINLKPLSVWKKLGLHELISTRLTLELGNRAICTSAGITRDVFILVGKFTFLTDFVIVNYESDPRVPFILGRSFLRTARALTDVHREEMILRDGDKILTLNMRHVTSSYSNQPQKESINMINIYDDSCKDFLEDLFATNHLSGNPTFSSRFDLTSPKSSLPPHNINPLSGSTTSSSSPDHLLEEFIDELALITFLPGNDDLLFDIESDLKEIEYLLNHDPIKEMDSILNDSIDERNLAEPNDNLVDTVPEMFTDEHALDYSSPPLYDDDHDELESSDFLLSPKYDSFLFEDFSKFDAFPSTNNEDKVFNPSILIHENLFEVNTCIAPDKNAKKIAISNASLILEDFDPPLDEIPFHKEVLGSETLLSFSFENEEKVFKPGILTSKVVHSSLLSELSHRGYKVFKLIKNFESPMEIFPCSFREDIRILDVPCLHCYPP
nr:hypothetical protein [Tanacetum cinerariifolium]